MSRVRATRAYAHIALRPATTTGRPGNFLQEKLRPRGGQHHLQTVTPRLGQPSRTVSRRPTPDAQPERGHRPTSPAAGAATAPSEAALLPRAASPTAAAATAPTDPGHGSRQQPPGPASLAAAGRRRAAPAEPCGDGRGVPVEFPARKFPCRKFPLSRSQRDVRVGACRARTRDAPGISTRLFRAPPCTATDADDVPEGPGRAGHAPDPTPPPTPTASAAPPWPPWTEARHAPTPVRYLLDNALGAGPEPAQASASTAPAALHTGRPPPDSRRDGQPRVRTSGAPAACSGSAQRGVRGQLGRAQAARSPP